MEQLKLARNAVFNSWWNPKANYYRKMEKIPDNIGTAANVQAMVFGNMGDDCCTGVGFTRDPGSGEKLFYGEFLVNAQGEDVVAGIRTPSPISALKDWNADVYNQLVEITTMLEKHYKDMQDFEFTVQENTLYMLQTRNGKRTGPAAVRVAVEMHEEGLIDEKTAVLRVAPSQLDQLLHPVFDPASLKKLVKLTTGIDASPGAAVGRAAFSADDAVVMAAEEPGNSGPQGDHAGRHSRHGRGQGHPDRDRRQEQPRRGCGARHGPALRGGRGRAAHQRNAPRSATATVGRQDASR